MYSFFRRTIPVGSAQNSRSLSLIFGVLIFLLSFVTACVFIFTHGFHKWESGTSYKMTVELPVSVQNPNNHEHVVAQVVQELKNVPGVSNIKPVDPEKLRSMLKVWTGDSNASIDFPIPTLLDVEFDRTQNLDLDAVRARLRAISPDICIENHSTWSQKLVIFGKSLKLVTLVVGSFILFCTAVIVILVTKSALQAYYSTLDILRLLGAKDSYIARIFQNQILKSSLWGGICGMCFSIPTVYAFMMVLKYLGLEGITWNTILGRAILVMSLVPLAGALMGIIVSRITVLVHLRLIDKNLGS
ncbi:MAG: hypothetical protein LBQ43_02610 [Holosporales bacterium]|jgi:cell division transport system permease protein|nr:hypothetical protein [Holosporales bacterium]